MRLEPASEAARDVAQDGLAGIRSIFDYKLLSIGDLTVTVGQIVAMVVVILLTWVAAIVTRRMFQRYGERHPDANQASLYTVTRLVQYVVLVIGALVALNRIGISMGQFAVVAGALGVGLGFGLQAIFSNFVSGLILLFDRSLKVGDFVELDGNVRGTVRAIDIRATRITTNDNIDLIVPNSEFVTGRVVNWTHGSVHRRIRVDFSVAYGVDKELVKKAALEAAGKVRFTLTMDGTQQPQVWLVGFAESRVDFLLVVWLTEEAARRNVAIRAAYLWELDTALKNYGIEIPVPQRDLHVRSLFGRESGQALDQLRGMLTTNAAGAGAGAPDAGDGRREQLSAGERQALSGNDALQDVHEQVEHDTREAEREAQADRSTDGDHGRGPTDPGARR